MVVVDANLLVALVSGDPRGGSVLRVFNDWLDRNIATHAPELARYEFTNALARLVVAGAFPADKVGDAWDNVSLLPIRYHQLNDARRVLEVTLALNRQSAYDAAYVVLAEQLGAELWTMDGPLYRNAVGLGFPVKLLT